MKPKILTSVCIVILVLICCHKESSDDYKSAGKIIGPDIRMCACCGGYYIQIDSVMYEFDALPDNSGINLEKETYPVSVRLDWQPSDKAACPNTRITITRIIKE